MANAAVCGNGIVETGEKCDCGFPEQCTDSCCNSTSCQLVAGVDCSPSQGACCETSCTFSTTSKVCAIESECTNSMNCNGTSAACPSQSITSKPDLTTTCNQNTQVCIKGVS